MEEENKKNNNTNNGDLEVNRPEGTALTEENTENPQPMFPASGEGKQVPAGISKWRFRDTISLLALLLAILLIVFFMTRQPPSIEESTATAKEALASVEQKDAQNPFDAVELSAEAAFVLDTKSGEVIFEKDAELQRPLASLTKIMTAVTALRAMPEYANIRIEKEHISREGDIGLLVGEEWRLSELLKLTLLSSSNDGAAAVADILGEKLNGSADQSNDSAFRRAMNRTANELGLQNTYFLNGSGLDESESISGGYGTSKDMAELFAYAVTNHREVFEVTSEKSGAFSSADGRVLKVSNTNQTVYDVPLLVASKTGFTDLAGGNLVIAFEAGIDRLVVVSVLGSTVEERFDDANNLAWAAVRYIANSEE